MKEFTHKIRQIFMSTRVIENRAKYQILCFGCVGIHFVFSMLMLIGNIKFLFALNIIATFFYVFLGCVLAPKEKYKMLFIAAFIEVEINTTVSSIMLGSGYEFMVYTLSLIPGAFYLAHTWPEETKNKYGISMIPSISTIIVGAMYILADIVQSVITPSYQSDRIIMLKPVFHYLNIMIAVVLLLAFSILFALEVRYTQKLLNDENSRLDEIASKDPLTKALNRRSLYNIINEEIKNDEHIEFGLILLDIDDFKNINDTYGHIVGDQVLLKTTNILKENLREGDYCCRWGGEEFILMIHGKSSDFEIVAERIRASIEKYTFSGDKYDFSVTATFGISEYQVGLQIRTLIEMADQKLYFGKKHGKNQVVK